MLSDREQRLLIDLKIADLREERELIVQRMKARTTEERAAIDMDLTAVRARPERGQDDVVMRP